MDIKIITSILILIAAIGSAIWNLHVKKSENSLSFVTLMVVPQFLIAAPLTIFLPLPTLMTFLYLFSSSLVQTLYIIFLVNAYRHGHLNRVYPLAIGSATLISLIVGHIFLGHKLSIYEYSGVLVLSFVIISFTFFGNGVAQTIKLKSIFYAFGTSLLIFGYTIIDTHGIRNAMHPLSYISWLFSIKAIMLFLPMLFLHKINWQMAKKNKEYIIAGLLAGFGYAVAVFAFVYSATSVVLALRSTSILFVYLLSIFILKEKKSFKILNLTVLTSIGVFLILMS